MVKKDKVRVIISIDKDVYDMIVKKAIKTNRTKSRTFNYICRDWFNSILNPDFSF